MGLSSSQARLLNLTARMHQIEYKAAKLEAQKLQMANESTRVYEDYLDALDKTKVQYKVLTTDGSVTYRDIQNYQDFLDAGYALDYNGRVFDGTETYIDNNNLVYKKAGSFNVTQEQINRANDPDPAKRVPTPYNIMTPGKYYLMSTKEGTKVSKTEAPVYTPLTGGAVTLKDNPATGTYAQLCHEAFGSDLKNPPTNVSEVITNLINSGEVTIVTTRKDGLFPFEGDEDFANFETSISTNTGLQEVSDEVELKKAEAKYEADMKKIDTKDRKFDTDLAAIETERNAIKQEMETLKTVAKDNVERTFKLFS